MAKKQPEPKTFEDAIGELEKLLAEMERGDVPLEESLVRYDRGNYLIGFCRQVLTRAERQIEQSQKPDDAADAPVPSPGPPGVAAGTRVREGALPNSERQRFVEEPPP